jgi:hypothetical protein
MSKICGSTVGGSTPGRKGQSLAYHIPVTCLPVAGLNPVTRQALRHIPAFNLLRDQHEATIQNLEQKVPFPRCPGLSSSLFFLLHFH